MSGWGNSTMGGARPGTQAIMRPGSQGAPGSRQGTRYGQAAGQGDSLSQKVEVSARPTVMREGMKSSAGPTSHGAGRQVHDRSYFMGVIRPRVTEITAEIERLRAEEDRITNNSGMLLQMQQKQKTLADEIGKLKSSLSDINFAVEQSTNGDPEKISASALKMKQDNAEGRRQVDKVFLQAKDSQSQLKNLQKELEDELKRLDDKLKSSNTGLYAQYRSARDDAYRMADQVAQIQQEIRAQETKMDSLNLQLSQDPDKKRAAALVIEILAKRSSRDEMARECSLTVEEEKAKLVAEAKANAQDIDVLSRQITEMRDAIQDSQGRVTALDDDLSEYSGDNARKFQELQEKDREMQEFIDTFQAREKEEAQKIDDLETLIQALLEHISRKQQLKAQIPKENAALNMDQMNTELGQREGQLNEAKQTYERLQKQLAEKKEDFDKVKFLEQKINGELEAISNRVEEQKVDIERFSDLEGLRREIEARKKHLTELKGRLSVQREASKTQLNRLSQEAEKLKTELTNSDVYKSMQQQEQRLRVVRQAFFALEDFVRTKEKETQYQGMKADCIRMVDEIHVVLRDPKRLDTNTATMSLM
jgi:intraflagellar transport protein 74